MRFYENKYPNKDEVTICTVREFVPNAGFRVHLDEYDLDGLIPLAELHTKKIRVPLPNFLKTGSQIPLVVHETSDTGTVYLSKKEVRKSMATEAKQRFILNTRLFGLSKKLPGDKTVWDMTLRLINRPDLDLEDEHPWVAISNREFDDLDLDPEQIQILKDNHTKLFGIKPQALRAKFTVYSFAIDGNQKVKDTLIRVRDDLSGCWSNQELYDDTSRCNLSILPVGIPTFQVKIVAYNRENCIDVYQRFKDLITNSGLDHYSFTEPENTTVSEK